MYTGGKLLTTNTRTPSVYNVFISDQANALKLGKYVRTYLMLRCQLAQFLRGQPLGWQGQNARSVCAGLQGQGMADPRPRGERLDPEENKPVHVNAIIGSFSGNLDTEVSAHCVIS